MTRAQEYAVDDLALRHGQVAVNEGYADGAVRVWARSAAHYLVYPDGNVAQQGASPRSDLDWDARGERDGAPATADQLADLEAALEAS